MQDRGRARQGACMSRGICGKRACMAGGGGMCGKEGMYGGGHVWQGSMHGRGECVWQEGHAWLGGGMCGRGACMAEGDVCGREGMHVRGACVTGEMATEAGNAHVKYWIHLNETNTNVCMYPLEFIHTL